eukprot:849222_1
MAPIQATIQSQSQWRPINTIQRQFDHQIPPINTNCMQNVFNVRYFETQPKHAAFILKSKLKRLTSADETSFILNETVIVTRIPPPHNRGTIRYIGARHDTHGLWFGIQLDKTHNKGHDGVVTGKRYFSVSNGHGIMLKESNISHVKKTQNTQDIPNIPDAAEISSLPLSPNEPDIPGIPPIPPLPSKAVRKRISPMKSSQHNKSQIANKIKTLSEVQPKIELKQKVYIPRLGLGIVEYIGNEYGIPLVQLRKQNDTPNILQSVIIGICLQNANGNTNGKLKGLKLFSCPPQHGIYIKYEQIMNIRSTQRQLLKHLIDTPMQSNNVGDLMNISHLMLDYAVSRDGGRQAVSNIFRAIDKAMQSKDLDQLQTVLQQAFECNIPPSAPKIIEAHRMIQYLKANNHLNVPKSTSGRPPTSTAPQQRITTPHITTPKLATPAQYVQASNAVKNPKSLSGRTDDTFFKA